MIRHFKISGVLCLFLLISGSAIAQKEATWWHFGSKVGLNFTKVFNNGQELPDVICDGPYN